MINFGATERESERCGGKSFADNYNYHVTISALNSIMTSFMKQFTEKGQMQGNKNVE